MTSRPISILVVNGNTSLAVTRIVADAARAAAGAGTRIVPVTAAHGVPVVQTAADHLLAYRACLDAVRRSVAGCDAVLMAVSLDTAVEELQRNCSVPVVGMTQAALSAARQLGGAVGVLTIGETMTSLFLERFGPHSVTLVHTIELGPVGALEDRARATRLLVKGAADLAARGAKVVIPIGATVAGLADSIARDTTIPVLDSVACGVRLAERLVHNTRGEDRP